MNEMDSDFAKLYYDETKAGSFSGFDKFWESVKQAHPHARRSEAERWYKSQPLVQENKTTKRPEIYRKWIVGNSASFLSMDNLFVGRRFGPNHYENAYTGLTS